MAPGQPEDEVARAAPLPVYALKGAPDQVLKHHANAGIALTYDVINQLRRDAAKARQLAEGAPASTAIRGLGLSMFGERSAGTLASRLIELTVGSKIDIGIKIKNQNEVPPWEDLPEHIRSQVEDLIEQGGHWQLPNG